MSKHIQNQTGNLFDAIRQVDVDGTEFWYARDLAKALEYGSWERFETVVTKAKASLVQTGMPVENHFRHMVKMVSVGYGNDRPISDIKLTRYACYIIAQNGSAAKKPRVAEAQAYFAHQTRKQELTEQREKDFKRIVARQRFSESDKQISEALYQKGIEGSGIKRVKSSGDSKMFGGKSTIQMKKEYGITNPKTPLANRMPNVMLAAKSLANEMTSTNLQDLPIDSFDDIKGENDSNNQAVRDALLVRGIIPEEVLPEEDTALILRRIKEQDKQGALED